MTTATEEQENPEFDRWCFTAKDDSGVLFHGKPLPLLTKLLYRVCDGNHGKFIDVTKALREAFEAGQRAPRTCE